VSKIFSADQIRLKLVDLLSGTADPSSAGGVSAQIASFYQRQNGAVGEAWLKTGAADTAWTQLKQSMAWYNVRDYGAVGDGVTDDRPAIEAAITACQASTHKGKVYFPRGTYLISQNGTLGYSFQLDAATNMELEGTGEGTVLRMSGDAGASAWSLFRLTGNCSGIRFSDIVFDGSGVANAVTTDHLLQVGTGVGSMTAISFFRCKFTGMVAGSGDAIHFQAADANPIERYWIIDCRFDGVGQYGIHVNQGCSFGFIQGNFMTNCLREIVFDTTEDVAIGAHVIVGNTLIHTSTDKLAIQMNGPSTTLISRSTVSQNVIVGGFVEMSEVQEVTIVGNIQTSGTFPSGNAAWRMTGLIHDVAFAGNFIDRSAGASTGVCVSLESSGGNAATRVRIGTNAMINEVAAAGFVLVNDAKIVSIGNNLMRNANTAGGSTAYGIEVDAVTATVDDMLIVANQITAAAGSLAAGILLKASGQDIINVAVKGNLGDQIDYGLELNAEAGAGTFSGKIMYAANNFDSSVGDYRNTGTAAVIPIIGFNGGTFGAQLFTGSGTPEGVVTARTGSMYLNSAGGDSTTVYYKESGVGNTGWVAIGGDILTFGVGTTTPEASAVYMGAGYITTPSASEIQMSVTRPGTIRNLYLRVQGAGTGTQNVTYTVRKNGVDTPLTVAVANDAVAPANATDTTHSFTVKAGDLISISIVKTAGVAVGQTDVIATVELI
jgi:hypothetical protein